MSQNSDSIAGDRYLRGLLAFLYGAIRRNVSLMAVTILVVMVIAYLVTPRPVELFRGEEVVRLGRVAGAEVLTSQSVAGLLSTALFHKNVLRMLAIKSNDGTARLISDSLVAHPEASDVVTIGVAQPDEQRVRKSLEAVFQLLNDEEGRVRQSKIDEIKAHLALIDTEIANFSAIQDAIWAEIKAPPANNASVSAGGNGRNLFDTLSKNETALSQSRESRLALVAQLSNSQTYPTAIVGDVSVTSTALSPRPTMVALLAGGFTFLAFLLFSLVTHRMPD